MGPAPVAIKPLLGTCINARWVSTGGGETFLEITPAPVQVRSGSFHNAVSGSPTHTFQKTQLDVSSAQLLLCWISRISLAFSAMGKSKKGDTRGEKKTQNSTFSNFTKMYGHVSKLIGSLPGVEGSEGHWRMGVIHFLLNLPLLELGLTVIYVLI